MHTPDEKITAKQEAFLTALLTARTFGDAAAAANVSEATARRWLALPQVQRAHLDARRQLVDHALSTIQRATGAAVATLLQCMRDDMPPSVRLGAARVVLETAVKAVELGDLAARVDQLEAAFAEQQQQQPTPPPQLQGPRPIGGLRQHA